MHALPPLERYGYSLIGATVIATAWECPRPAKQR
jgi:hypothetical protein